MLRYAVIGAAAAVGALIAYRAARFIGRVRRGLSSAAEDLSPGRFVHGQRG